jgi:hypothetical protein
MEGGHKRFCNTPSSSAHKLEGKHPFGLASCCFLPHNPVQALGGAKTAFLVNLSKPAVLSLWVLAALPPPPPRPRTREMTSYLLFVCSLQYRAAERPGPEPCELQLSHLGDPGRLSP